MSQSVQIPKLEDIVWAELLFWPTIKSRNRNQTVIKQFAEHGWIKHTSRKSEFAITESGKQIAEMRLAQNWPAWKNDLEAFERAGLSPEDFGAWRLLKRQNANQLPRSLKQINRRTLNAWLRRHSKTSSELLPEIFADVQITVDEVTRMRLPPRSKLIFKDEKTIECDFLMEAFGEVVIPERAWSRIQRIETPQSHLIFSIENKGAFVDFPTIASATLIFLPGENITAIHQLMSRIDKQPILHFGDLDTKGIEIFHSLLSAGFSVRHFVPSYVEEFVNTHALPCENDWIERDYSLLHPVVAMLASQKLWMEQESLVLDQRFEAEIREIIGRIVKGDNQPFV